MAKTLTGKYDSLDKARNALDDLINIGLDREKVFLDRDNTLVKVIIPNDIEREVRGILDSHGPVAVTERTM
jgi:hypothetical protein